MDVIKKFLKIILLTLFFLQTVGCTSKKELKSFRWTGKGDKVLLPVQFLSEQKLQKIGSEKLVLSKQILDGVEIEGGYLKTISKCDGELIFAKWAYLDQLPRHLQKQKKRMEQNQDDFQRNLKLRHVIFESYTVVSKPELFLNTHGRLLWKLEYADDLGQFFAAYFDEEMNLVRTLRLSSAFDSNGAIGSVYPLGPLQSSVQNVRLKHLVTQKELTSLKLKVQTKSDLPALAEQGQFVFDADDDRLKQVQVYYDIIESMDWFNHQFGFELMQPLLVETSLGFPEKTNAAFYFRSKINLGDGDGIVYKDMALDPSVTRHESVHAVIDQIAGLTNENESASLNEALADYFTATQRNNPKMGEESYQKGDGKRTLANAMKFSEKNGGTYHDSLLVSGMLWQVREEVGVETADRLVWETLKRLQPHSDFKDFSTEFVDELQKLPTEAKNKIVSVLLKREWP